MNQYSGSISIFLDGDVVYEYDLNPDEIIECLLRARTREHLVELSGPEIEGIEIRDLRVSEVKPKGKKVASDTPQKKKGFGCDQCGSKGPRHKLGCTVQAGHKKVDEEITTERPGGQQALKDADARLRVRRMVEAKVGLEDISAGLKRAGFSYTDRQVEEMIAWAEHQAS